MPAMRQNLQQQLEKLEKVPLCCGPKKAFTPGKDEHVAVSFFLVLHAFFNPRVRVCGFVLAAGPSV